jgi:hypothetical protein
LRSSAKQYHANQSTGLTRASRSDSMERMAEPAIIRYNPGHKQLEIQEPSGEEYGPLDYPDSDGDNLVYMLDDPDNLFVAVLDGGYDGLEENTLYRLVPVDTDVEEVDVFEPAEEEGEEEDEEDETPEPAA